ncbi:MAG: diacylglycerol/polyprenol kinase family protein [Candidatus Heimdallarchaeota archaeon]
MAVSKMAVHQSTQSQGLLRESARKSFHLLVLGIPIAYHIFHITLEIIILAFLIILVLFIPIESIRLNFPGFFLNRVVRKSEEGKIAGYVPTTIAWFGLALGAQIQLYPFEYAEAAIIATVVGDAAAALAGKSFGTHRLVFTQKKTVEGWLAGFVVTWFVSGAFLALVEKEFALILGLGVAIIFLLTDLRENPPTDLLSDNILNPILGTIMATLVATSITMI